MEETVVFSCVISLREILCLMNSVSLKLPELSEFTELTVIIR